MNDNSTNWRNKISSISLTLNSLTSQTAGIEELQTNITDFVTDVDSYEQDLSDGFSTAEDIILGSSIAFYIFYSFILIIAVSGMLLVPCLFCFNVYVFRKFLNCAWGCYFVLSILLFVFSGLVYAGSFFTYDICTGYDFYFNNLTNFNTLPFADKDSGNILR